MKPISNELIQKYLDGKCSPAEEEVVINWYNSFENRHDPYSDLTASERGEMNKRMLGNIEKGIRTEKPRYHFKKVIYPIAVAATILLLANYVLFHFTPFSSKQPIGQVPKPFLVNNTTRSILKKVLPDKSTVWLSPGAKIEYGANFQSHRVVRLTGESFFEVTKDKQHPFVVYSEHITTKVWGTSFRIRDSHRSASAEVAVVTGKVSVRAKGTNNKEVMLLPKQLVVYEVVKQHLKMQAADRTTDLQIWQKTNLVFEKTILKEVIEALNKEFQVQITLDEESLNQLEMQADFNNQSLPDILIMLCKLTGCTYTTDGQHFDLKRKS